MDKPYWKYGLVRATRIEAGGLAKRRWRPRGQGTPPALLVREPGLGAPGRIEAGRAEPDRAGPRPQAPRSKGTTELPKALIFASVCSGPPPSTNSKKCP